jgi:hypothetical protein
MTVDNVRLAIRARMRSGYVQKLARQLIDNGTPVSVGSIEQFATGASLLPAAVMNAIVADIWPNASWDAATGTVVRHAREATSLGRPPAPFAPTKEVATNEHGRIWPGLREQLEEQERQQWARAKALARGAR